MRPSPDWRHADRAREQEEAQAKAEEHVTMPLLAPQPAGEALIGARAPGRRGARSVGWRLEAILTDNGSEFVPCARALLGSVTVEASEPSDCAQGRDGAGGPANATSGLELMLALVEWRIWATLTSSPPRVSALTGFGLASSQMATA